MILNNSDFLLYEGLVKNYYKVCKSLVLKNFFIKNLFYDVYCIFFYYYMFKYRVVVKIICRKLIYYFYCKVIFL